MYFKGGGPVLFALLAIAFIVGTYAANYEKFLRQHYDNPMSSVGNRYCDTMMQKRGMTNPKCKEVNSFIHETKRKIVAVCGKGGKPYQNGMQQSNNKFSVTTCKHHGGSLNPPCKYRGSKSSLFIVVRCEKGYPVHYDQGHI